MQSNFKPDYKKKLNYSNATNGDLIKVVEGNFQKSVDQVKNIAKKFKRDTAEGTAFEIWRFLKSNVKYKKDGYEEQTIKLPARLVADGSGDCKSYSLFAASILGALKYPVVFRYASYNANPIPSHVYAVTRDEQGKEIIIDGVYNFFNAEKRPTYKFDHTMKVYTLSGITYEAEEQDIGSFLTNLVKKYAKSSVGKAHLKASTAVSKAGTQVAKAVKNISLTVPRMAFLQWVAFNVGGSATKLKKVMDKGEGKQIWDKWKSYGGKPQNLEVAIKLGATKKRLFGVNGLEEITCGEDGIGDAAGIAAVIAAAAPMIIAFASLLKKGETEEEQKDAAGNKTQTTVEKIIDIAKTAYKAVTKNNVYNLDDEIARGKVDLAAEHNDYIPGQFQVKPVYLLGGAVLLYFMLK